MSAQINLGRGFPLHSIQGGFNVSPSNSVDLPYVTREIQATVAGDIAMIFYDGSELTVPFEEGEVRAFSVRRVLATGTTATGIKGFY